MGTQAHAGAGATGNRAVLAAGPADVDAVLAGLQTGRQGLTADEAARRLAETGPNAIPDEHRSVLAELGT